MSQPSTTGRADHKTHRTRPQHRSSIPTRLHSASSERSFTKYVSRTTTEQRWAAGVDGMASSSAPAPPSALGGAQQRPRTTRACDRCRFRKRRCVYSGSDDVPCDECRDFCVECTFRHPGFGRGLRQRRRWDPPSRRTQEEQQSSTTLATPATATTGTPGEQTCHDGSASVTISTPSSVLSQGQASSRDLPAQVASVASSRSRSVGHRRARLGSGSGSGFAFGSGSALSVVSGQYRDFIEPYAPFLDLGGPLSEVTACCLAAAMCGNGSGSGRDGVADVELWHRMALRYLREAPTSALTEQEIRAVLLLWLRTPSAADDAETRAVYTRVSTPETCMDAK